MQLEQQETFRIEGPQLEVFGQAESKLPAPAKKRPAAALALVVLALVSVLGIGGAKLNTKYNQVRAIYSASNEHGQSMENDLSLRADAAANLIRLCGQVLGEDAPSVQAAQQALDDWNATDADHPADQFAANTALGSVVDIMYNEVEKYLAEKGIKIYRAFVGNYMTSLEMAGCSVTLLKLDDELKTYLDYPSEAPAFRV